MFVAAGRTSPYAREAALAGTNGQPASLDCASVRVRADMGGMCHRCFDAFICDPSCASSLEPTATSTDSPA
jgi:hypothetical protein